MIVPEDYWFDDDEHEDGFDDVEEDEVDPGYDGILGEG